MSDVAEPAGATAEVMGPWGEVRTVPQAVQRLAREKLMALYRASPWLEKIDGAAMAIVRADVTHKKRLKMLRALADKVNAAVSKEAACKRGCNACCKIQVEMSVWEAGLIGAELGLEVKTPPELNDSKARSLELLGRACGFLKEGECSIYESRPLACRIHHSLNLDAAMCQPDVKPEDSMVPSLTLTGIKEVYAVCSGSMRMHDLSDFFEEARRGEQEQAWVEDAAVADSGVTGA